MSEENDGLFRTMNIPLAAYLTFHVEPVRKEWKKGTFFWLFREDRQLRMLVTGFTGGKAMVDARAYSHRLTSMRKEVFEEKRKQT